MDCSPSSTPVFHRCIETEDASKTLQKQEYYRKTSLKLLKKKDAGFMRPSISFWSSLQLVKKKDGSYHPRTDFRAVTKDDKYPLPTIYSLSKSLHIAKIFSKLDPKRAYYLRIQSDDIEKIACTTPFSLFEFINMPQHSKAS